MRAVSDTSPLSNLACIRRFSLLESRLLGVWIAAAIIAVTLNITRASAQESVPLPPAPENDPFVGTWKANPSKSHPELGKRDASYIRTIGREGDLLVFSSSNGTKAPSNNYKIRCDGHYHHAPFGGLSCKYVATNRVEGETVERPQLTNEAPARPLSGKPEYWSREVSPDGQEMAILEYTDGRRTKLKKGLVLDRVK